VNLVGAFGGSKFKTPNSFQNRREKLRKNGNFYAKSVFDKIDFSFCCNSKTKERIIGDT